MDDSITVRGWLEMPGQGGEKRTVPCLIVGPRAVLAPGLEDDADVPIYAVRSEEGGEEMAKRERTVATVTTTRDGRVEIESISHVIAAEV